MVHMNQLGSLHTDVRPLLAQVHLVMDFHVHLSQCEATGLLGGHWDPDTHTLRVQQAFPCRWASCMGATLHAASCSILDEHIKLLKALVQGSHQQAATRTQCPMASAMALCHV